MAAEAPSPRRLPRAEREQQILDVAHDLFATHGYAQVTMDGVAAQVGVTKPLLYAYWGNKERLYSACLERDADLLVAMVGDAVGAAANPVEALEFGIRSFFSFVQAESGAFRVLFDETQPASGDVARQVADHRQRIVGLVATTLIEQLPESGRRGRAAIEVEALSNALLGAAESLARWWLASGGSDIPADEAAELLISTVQPGLRLRSEAPVGAAQATEPPDQGVTTT